jgi:ABC-type Na+ efflux pump permease subunit
VTDSLRVPARPRPPGDLITAWLIARRAALESLQDRFSLLGGLVLSVGAPLVLLLVVIYPALAGGARATAGAVLGSYVLVVGVLPAFSAVGIAAGQFAGEKERGVLTPLLASPAGNVAIFGGKVLGAIIPPLLYAAVAETVYLGGAALLAGPTIIGRLSPSVTVATVLLVPAVACFAAAVASLVSSRVRTFNAAQQLSGLALMPVWGIVFGLATHTQRWDPLVLFVAVAILLLVDAGLVVLAGATWRREDVLAQR